MQTFFRKTSAAIGFGALLMQQETTAVRSNGYADASITVDKLEKITLHLVRHGRSYMNEIEKHQEGDAPALESARQITGTLTKEGELDMFWRWFKYKNPKACVNAKDDRCFAKFLTCGNYFDGCRDFRKGLTLCSRKKPQDITPMDFKFIDALLDATGEEQTSKIATDGKLQQSYGNKVVFLTASPLRRAFKTVLNGYGDTIRNDSGKIIKILPDLREVAPGCDSILTAVLDKEGNLDEASMHAADAQSQMDAQLLDWTLYKKQGYPVGEFETHKRTELLNDIMGEAGKLTSHGKEAVRRLGDKLPDIFFKHSKNESELLGQTVSIVNGALRVDGRETVLVMGGHSKHFREFFRQFGDKETFEVPDPLQLRERTTIDLKQETMGNANVLEVVFQKVNGKWQLKSEDAKFVYRAP